MIKTLPTFQPDMHEALVLQRKLKALGILLDIPSGHLFYEAEFKPLALTSQFVFVRHGETYGNCGQSTSSGSIDQELVKLGVKNRARRIYQGDVDTDINQLTAHGKAQAIELAEKLENSLLRKHWVPDIIVHSPLTRAKETGQPFVRKHQFSSRYFCYDAIKEIKFGAWENYRICDFDEDNSCHLFYRENHALVKSSGINATGLYHSGECFAEAILRAHQALCELDHHYCNKKILMFSHSMFGAACNILFGHGKYVEDTNYLAFDGKRKDGQSYALPFAEPLFFNV